MTGSNSVAPGSAEIIAANKEFQQQVGNLLGIPISVLTRQRDEALRMLAEERGLASEAEARLLAEQDQLVSQLMAQHEAEIRRLQGKLKTKAEELERAQVLTPIPPDLNLSTENDSADAEQSQAVEQQLLEQIAQLQRQLESAYAEIDETRADAARLQEERDEAIRATDDATIDLQAQMDQIQDDANELQLRLDEMHRVHEDSEDRARAEAILLTDELNEARQLLDQRNSEVHRLRARFEQFAGAPQPSHPPPPGVDHELKEARTETQRLRKQLIHAKRELNRATRELTALRSQRPALPTNPFAAGAPARRGANPVPRPAMNSTIQETGLAAETHPTVTQSGPAPKRHLGERPSATPPPLPLTTTRGS